MLEKKGVPRHVLLRLKNLYKENKAVVVVKSIPGKSVKNVRLFLKQGDLPSVHLFSYGIDPLLSFLEKRLKAILISSVPVQGPVDVNNITSSVKSWLYADQLIKPVEMVISIMLNSLGCIENLLLM